MREFTETHAPGLYDLVLKSISREDDRLSEEYVAIQEQRTVVLLHTLTYFRSQKTCLLQKDEGLFLQQHGASRSAINAGRVLGFSTSPRNIDQHKQQLICTYPAVLQQNVMAATKGQFLMVNLLDDFHNIFSYIIRLPSKLKLSVATHMASSLLDIHENIPAVHLPLKRGSQHSSVKVKVSGTEKDCRGGIIVANIKELLDTYNEDRHKTFLEKMPSGLSPKNIQQQIKELRVYSELSHDELSTLNTTVLIDEFEQSLKSMEDYQAAIHHIFCQCPPLHNYLQQYVLPAPGHWPTWFYQKKLIAQSSNPSILSIIPEQGPFHVFLNLQEDIIKSYHFMLGTIYHQIFGSVLPLKPKPFRINILINAVFLGWLKIRSKVLQKFKLCKDIEYACLLHLLEEVIPLGFFHYSLIFRSGDLEGYTEIMLRLLIVFIIWKRKHYHRSTLSMLSDLWYHKKEFPDYYTLKRLWMTLITEKKVEIWHSMLRNRIQIYDDAQQIKSKATAIAASKSEQNFQNSFVKPYKRGCSEKDMSIVAGKSAEVLLSTIKRVGQNLGKSKQVQLSQNTTGKTNDKKYKYHLHTFDSTVDSKALPFAYTHSKSAPARFPDATKVCDYANCHVTDIRADAIRLPCFHTLHKSCFNLIAKKCPICTKNLDVRINNLATAFNETLLKPTARSNTTSQNSSDDDDDDDDVDGSDDDSIQINQTVDPAYYSSRAWESCIDHELDTFAVLQPQINVSASSQQTSQSAHRSVAVNIQIAKSSLGTSKFWFLPPQLSQATLFGRNGSNACTFISLLMAKEYTTSLQYAALQLNCNSNLNQTWLSLILSAIARGNQVYDSVTQSQGLGNPFFSVAEAKHHLTGVIAPVTKTLEESLDLSITCVDLQVPQSSLAFYLQRLVRERNLAALVIGNGMTVCFVGQNNNVYFLDSHPHFYGQVFGAMVGMAPVDKLEEFLTNIKQQIWPNFNVCSLRLLLPLSK